ncbi:MAG: hypothetical protein K2X82_04010 [Gemmataceae bacterium]|nr:hypothetical protein [Gemmataceae bacterium]
MPRLVALPVLLAALVALVVAAAPVPEVRDPVYFPTKVGAKWVVRLSGQPGNGPGEVAPPEDFTYAVTAVETKDGVTTVSYGREIMGRVRGNFRVRVLKAGLFEEASMGRAFDPPLPLLKAPLKDGATWAWKGTFERDRGKKEERAAKWAVKGFEEVKVPAGTFTALVVERSVVKPVGKGETHEFVATEWHVKDVGQVKWVMDNLTEEMVSFTPGRD